MSKKIGQSIKLVFLSCAILFTGAALVVLPERKLSGIAYPMSQVGTPSLEPNLTDVPLYQQPTSETCGEAAFVMAWNYAHPDQMLDLNTVIALAIQNGWYIPGDPVGVYTSPAHMQEMASHYATQNNALTPGTGQMVDEQQALLFLFSQIIMGRPVVVDVNTIIGDTQSGAHFVVVTGISLIDGEIEYNDPYGYIGPTEHQADKKRERWTTFWESWRNNGDDNNKGNGWYMVVY
jgi:hypothetical protein